MIGLFFQAAMGLAQSAVAFDHTVTTAFGNATIAPNAWTVIKGKNLVPANTPSTGVVWSNAPEFASGRILGRSLGSA